LRIASPLRVYGAIELTLALVVSATLLLRFVPPDLLGHFPYRIRHGFYYPSVLFQSFKSLLAIPAIFLPCFLMGTTFPILCRVFSADSRFPSALYAWNALGACASVLICEFILLPRFGRDGTLFMILGLNLLIAAVFLLLPPQAPPPENESTADPLPPLIGPPSDVTQDFSSLIAGVIISGLAAGTLEAGVHQTIVFGGYPIAVAMSFVSFWVIAAIALAGWVIRKMPSIGPRSLKTAFLVAAISYWFIRGESIPILHWVQSFHQDRLVERIVRHRSLDETLATWIGMGALLAAIGLVVFPSYFLLSLVLPWICNRADRKDSLEKLYAANTIAFCAGMLIFSRAAPRVSIFYSLKLHTYTLALLAGLLLATPFYLPMQKWKWAAAALAFFAISLLTGKGFDGRLFEAGNPLRTAKVTSLKSNGTHTTYVVHSPDCKNLYFDSHSMSGTGLGGQIYMRMMAHFPLLLHPDPKSALLICFGVGNTASAIAAHSGIAHFDIVDLNDKVLETAPEFADTNDRVYEDPRVRMIVDDGRNFLRLADTSYDLITSEPPPPLHEGIYRLYSLEYYRAALDRLTPNGLMTQWLPLNQFTKPAMDLTVSTFVQAFPHSLLFIGCDDQFILMGSKAPMDLSNIEKNLSADPRVARDLADRCMITSPEGILARIVMSEKILAEDFGGHAILTDTRTDLSHYCFAGTTPLLTYDPISLWTELSIDRFQCAGALRNATSNPDNLKSMILFFPAQFLQFNSAPPPQEPATPSPPLHPQ
ncbi:hypothetical protein HYR69_12380, partial [Candidatus Sumerlaeota bacterium]|nr:hypothetical protein [Candidatus Sumerlaeota bacterium]